MIFTGIFRSLVISYQAITGNNNLCRLKIELAKIISYQAIIGNNNEELMLSGGEAIIPYQAITGNNKIIIPTFHPQFHVF